MDIYEALDYGSLSMEHHGVLGMKWGHRKQRIAAQRAVFSKAAVKAGNETFAYADDYAKAKAKGDIEAMRNARRNVVDAKSQTVSYMIAAAGRRHYTRGDLKYAQKYIDGEVTMKQLSNRMKRQVLLGYSAVAAFLFVPAIANGVHNLRNGN